MATIQKRPCSKGNAYRVIIRKKGIRQISKTFSSKKLALQFAQRVESDKELLLAYGNSNKASHTLEKLTSDYLSNEYSGKDYKKQSTRLDFWVKSIEIKQISDITSNIVSAAQPWAKGYTQTDRPWAKGYTQTDRPWADGYVQTDRPWAKGYIQNDRPWAKGYRQTDRPWAKGYRQKTGIFSDWD